MARRTKSSGPTPEEIQAQAEEKAAADAALLAALQARDAEPKQQTLGEQFIDIAHLLARAKRETRLSEATLIKAWELNLMWVLNNRQQPQPSFSYDDLPGSGEEPTEGENALPVPNEVLGDETPSEE